MSLKVQVSPAKGEEPQQIQQEGWLVQAEERGEPVARHKHIQKDLKELISEHDHKYYIGIEDWNKSGL